LSCALLHMTTIVSAVLANASFLYVRQRTEQGMTYAQAVHAPSATCQVNPVFCERLKAIFSKNSHIEKGFPMNRSIVISGLLGVLSLAACDKTPTVINVPATPVAVPGPAGPQGATGSQGETGYQGEAGRQGATGKPGENTTVIVVPPVPSAPAN
jgi:hypothetical protein